MTLLLFGLALVISLLLIPFGLPGLFGMLAAAVVLNAVSGGSPIGAATIVVALVLAVVAELAEYFLSARYVRRFGGSRSGARGAIIGGIVGAILGVPFPIPFVGSVVGALVGAFAGALVGELRAGAGRGKASRAAGGALVGRVVGSAVKVGIGCAIAVMLFAAAIR